MKHWNEMNPEERIRASGAIRHDASHPHRAPWIDRCQRDGRDQNPVPNLANVMLALREEPALVDAFKFDEMVGDVMLTKTLPGEYAPQITEPRLLRDDDTAAVQEYLQLAGLIRLARDTTDQAINAHAREQRFHPVRDHLNSLAWDGQPRVGAWLHTYLGVDNTGYAARIGAMFLVAMVARIFRPGCKVDYVLILEGAQGEGKSTACAILGGRWFSDSLPDISIGKDCSHHLRGRWLVEIAELAALALGKSEAALMKAFLTRTEERYRPPYGKREVAEPRQCVFIGSTNEAAYLRDDTGARRFWPVKVGTIEIEALKRDRDQLFAEAVCMHNAGEKWWPDRDFEAEHIRPQQETRHATDAWEDAIVPWLEDQHEVNIIGVARDAIGLDTPKLDRATQNRIAAILRRHSWDNSRRVHGQQMWGRVARG